MSDELKAIEEKLKQAKDGQPIVLSGKEIELFMTGAAFVRRSTVEQCIKETECEEKWKQIALGVIDSIPDHPGETGLICCYTLGFNLSNFLAEFERVPVGLKRIRFRLTNIDRVPIVKTRDGYDPEQMMAMTIQVRQ